MNVIDFILARSDSMNEGEFFAILHMLVDQYGSALRALGLTPKDAYRENVLLANFLLQEIQENNGSYSLVRAPSRGTLSFLNKMLSSS